MQLGHSPVLAKLRIVETWRAAGNRDLQPRNRRLIVLACSACCSCFSCSTVQGRFHYTLSFIDMALKLPSIRVLSRYLLRPQASFHPRCQHRAQSKHYSAAAAGARLNGTVEYDTVPILHHTAKSTLSNPELPAEVRKGQTKRINLYTAINEALRYALQTDERVLVFGEDVQFGGVFRCTMNL